MINDFVQVLRRHQLRVSPAESLDALHRVGMGERDVLRTVDQLASVAEDIIKTRM